MLNKPNLFSKREDNVVTRDPRLPGQSQGASPMGNSPTGASPTPMNPSAPAPAAAREASPPRSSEGMSENRLIVGPDVKLKGAEILDCDTLVVEGRVEATMDSRVIQIAEHGAFAGKVGIDVAEIHGRFDGELVARSQLIIHATGRVSGTIRYGKILIEEGGEISGDVRSLAADAAAAPVLTQRATPLELAKINPPALAGSAS